LAYFRKKKIAEGYTLLFLDVSGFYLIPTVVRTWAPCGQTPILSAKLSRSKYNAIGAMTRDGRLFSYLDRQGFKTPAVIQFLRRLLRLLPGKLLIIWDNASTHHSHDMQDFLALPAIQARLQVLYLPTYAPELNPIELVWRYLKYVLLKNRVVHNLNELKLALRQAIRRLKRQPHLLRQFVRHAKVYAVPEPLLTSL